MYSRILIIVNLSFMAFFGSGATPRSAIESQLATSSWETWPVNVTYGPNLLLSNDRLQFVQDRPTSDEEKMCVLSLASVNNMLDRVKQYVQAVLGGHKTHINHEVTFTELVVWTNLGFAKGRRDRGSFAPQRRFLDVFSPV